MYKKITHSIQEEHFDHPMVLPLAVAARAGNSAIAIPTPTPPGLIAPLPPAVMTEYTMTFRMDSRTIWTRYALGMINYSVSDFGNLPGTPNVKNSMARNASTVGTFFTPYYGITAGTKIGELLTALLVNGEKVVEVIKSGKDDVAVYTGIWEKQCMSLAEYLNELNPTQYPTTLLFDSFINLTAAWVRDFKARFAGDFAADAVALDDIVKIGVTGIPDHLQAGYTSIADMLSRGIVAQFPLSFVR